MCYDAYCFVAWQTTRDIKPDSHNELEHEEGEGEEEGGEVSRREHNTAHSWPDKGKDKDKSGQGQTRAKAARGGGRGIISRSSSRAVGRIIDRFRGIH
jgi:hypothetical protein